MKAKRQPPVPQIRCRACDVLVNDSKKGRAKHEADGSHAKNAKRLVFQARLDQITGWTCPGECFPMQRPIPFLE